MILLLDSLCALVSFIAAPLAPRADCGVAWNTGWTNNTLGMSHLVANEDREAADDFDFTGALGRVFVHGTGPMTGSFPVDGVWVRFYAWTANGPGVLQHERFLAAGDPELHVTTIPETIDVELSPPFVATGKHFIAVQVDFPVSGGYWQPWTGSNVAPLLTHAWVRDNNAGATWAQYSDAMGPVNRDMSFELYSAATGACAEWDEVPTPVPSLDYTMLRDLDVIGANDVWAVGHYERLTPGYTEQMTLAMHFDGTQWSVTPTPSPAPGPNMSNDYLWAVDSVAANDVWAGGEQNMQVNGGWVGSQPRLVVALVQKLDTAQFCPLRRIVSGMRPALSCRPAAHRLEATPSMRAKDGPGTQPKPSATLHALPSQWCSCPLAIHRSFELVAYSVPTAGALDCVQLVPL